MNGRWEGRRLKTEATTQPAEGENATFTHTPAQSKPKQ
jgi:hypothetical protein